ncbi:pore-forming ESAT-6 family protein [Brachybacterium paraconglomeratum]|uniref:pore-forming ESAT-6 family protein n=1 Tax=Brachybacterium paraconglomeratum TaxID=173362 RepID=UPI00223B9633|nr:pore-forming ESAT-6 family protein [Brachybacterium paraconglomeratum]MCT1436116.1 pore-forming ESAT-6 family protein [Brachybacterium paraconglomeratum]
MNAGQNQIDRNSYNIGSSESAQANFEQVAARLEALLDRRDGDVKAAMAEYQADGVSEEYAALERQWNSAGTQVRAVITAIRNSLQENDEVARRALAMAKAAIPG